MTIGERIKRIRKENNLTLEKFGEKIKISGQSVSRLENGVNNPADRTIALICREFGVSEDWLRNGHGEMKKSAVLDDIINSQNLAGDAAELTKRFAQMFASLRPETQRDLLTNFDRYFGGQNPPITQLQSPQEEPEESEELFLTPRETPLTPEEINKRVKAYRALLERERSLKLALGYGTPPQTLASSGSSNSGGGEAGSSGSDIT